MQSEAVNGPTTSKRAGAAVPPFRWSEPVVANMTHRGQPERFAGLEFERMDPLAEALGGGAGSGAVLRAGGWGYPLSDRNFPFKKIYLFSCDKKYD